jgi:hypothetical protein
MMRPGRPQLGWWAVAGLGLIAATVIYSDLVRLRNPVGEKYVPLYPPGQLDFSCPYLGARALIAGVNPYRNDRPEFTHPVFGITLINGLPFKQIYPPGHILLYAPLAFWKGADGEAAGRIWFHLNLVALLALATIVWLLARRIGEARPPPLTPLWIPLFGVCMALSTGVELGLERGQSDIATAVMCWGATVCYLRGRSGMAMFLSIWGASIKGYPLLFVAGLGLLTLDRRGWKQALIGSALATAILVVPVARFLGDALQGVRHRSEMFWAVWYNHGFSNAVYQVVPAWTNRGRLVLAAFALAVTVATWIQARRASSHGTSAERALWVVVFTTVSLGAMVGYSALSVSYNLILILPGVLVIVACQARIGSWLSLPRWAEHLLGAALLASGFLLFVHRLGDESNPASGTGHAASAFGLVGLFFILAPILIRALRRPVGAT